MVMDCYIDPLLINLTVLLYSGPNLTLLLLLGWGRGSLPLSDSSLALSRPLDFLTVYPRLSLQNWPWPLWVSACMISQCLRVSGGQPTWPTYSHALMSSCLHIWYMSALSKVDMQLNVTCSSVQLSYHTQNEAMISWRNTKCITIATSMILPTTVDIHHGLNCFSEVPYAPHAST